MIVSESRTAGTTRLRLDGDESLDYTCAQAVRDDLLSRITGNTDVVVDLSGIEFIDSAGLGVLVSVYKAVRRSGRKSRYTGVRPSVMHVLQVIKLDTIFDLAPGSGRSAASR
jgi:anti-anti-sigma factor